ncbi:MAG: endonuclease [Oscillatoriales cyanobacterium RU_3_3]|nr:endonuclease [Oscillatoriales cyanobacterium RU_3_3]
MDCVYLLHFSRPINPSRPAQHYLGWSSDLDERLRKHRKGTGSRLCAVALERGITFVLAEVWAGDRSLESRLKRQHNSRKFCPICNRLQAAKASELAVAKTGGN